MHGLAVQCDEELATRHDVARAVREQMIRSCADLKKKNIKGQVIIGGYVFELLKLTLGVVPAEDGTWKTFAGFPMTVLPGGASWLVQEIPSV